MDVELLDTVLPFLDILLEVTLILGRYWHRGTGSRISLPDDGWISLEMIYGLFTCDVPTQAVCKWFKCSDAMWTNPILFGSFQWTGSQNWSERIGPSASRVYNSATYWTQNRDWLWNRIAYCCYYLCHIFTVHHVNTKSSTLVKRSVRFHFVFLEHDRVAVIRVNYSLIRWTEPFDSNTFDS